MKNISSFKKSILILLVVFLSIKNSYAIENKIIVRVNNEIISSIDILNEINYLKLLNPQIQELNNEKLFEVSKNSLIKEKIKKIYLLKLIDEIRIEEKYFDNLIKNIYSQKNIKSLQDYKLYLKTS